VMGCGRASHPEQVDAEDSDKDQRVCLRRSVRIVSSPRTLRIGLSDFS
jgi:hypothetical protein